MLTSGSDKGMQEGEFSEITLPEGDVCRMYKDGRVECRAPGEKEFTPRGAKPPVGSPMPDLNLKF